MKKLSLLLITSLACAKMEYTPDRIEQAKQLFEKWSVEFKHMSSDKVDATAEGATKLEEGNWGDVFFGKKDRVEFARALQATLLFKDCANENRVAAYNAFTDGQNPNGKITQEEFDAMYAKIQELKKHINLDALEGMIVMNDLTKFHDIQHAVQKMTGKTFADHDDALLELLELAETKKDAADLIPNFMKLDPNDRAFIREVWKARLNIAQFVQGECPEVALEKFVKLSPEQKLAGFLEVFSDVAGAGAHAGTKCVMNKFVYTPYMLAYEELNKSNDAHEVYTSYYRQRLEKAAVQNLDTKSSKEQLALAKMFCMRRGANAQQFEQVERAFKQLDEQTQKTLVRELTVTADETAITLMYAPTLMQKAKTEEELVAAMKLLVRYFNYARKQLLPTNFVFNINHAAKDTVSLNALLNHPIYVEHKGQGADLRLEEPVKASQMQKWGVYLSNQLSWISKKVKGSC